MAQNQKPDQAQEMSKQAQQQGLAFNKNQRVTQLSPMARIQMQELSGDDEKDKKKYGKLNYKSLSKGAQDEKKYLNLNSKDPIAANAYEAKDKDLQNFQSTMQNAYQQSGKQGTFNGAMQNVYNQDPNKVNNTLDNFSNKLNGIDKQSHKVNAVGKKDLSATEKYQKKGINYEPNSKQQGDLAQDGKLTPKNQTQQQTQNQKGLTKSQVKSAGKDALAFSIPGAGIALTLAGKGSPAKGLGKVVGGIKNGLQHGMQSLNSNGRSMGNTFSKFTQNLGQAQQSSSKHLQDSFAKNGVGVQADAKEQALEK